MKLFRGVQQTKKKGDAFRSITSNLKIYLPCFIERILFVQITSICIAILKLYLSCFLIMFSLKNLCTIALVASLIWNILLRLCSSLLRKTSFIFLYHTMVNNQINWRMNSPLREVFLSVDVKNFLVNDFKFGTFLNTRTLSLNLCGQELFTHTVASAARLSTWDLCQVL